MLERLRFFALILGLQVLLLAPSHYRGQRGIGATIHHHGNGLTVTLVCLQVRDHG